MKICIQSGHKNILTGATGAPGERDWNIKTTDLLAELLKSKGFEVYIADGKANTDNKVTSTDWDLFLAVHYDADIYNDRGGFIDTPDPSVDLSTKESNRIANILREEYFTDKLGIPERPKRSNANTRFYYMWSSLTAKTPCVLIECGVGWRKPEDYNTLYNCREEVVNALAKGICRAFNVEFETPTTPQPIDQLTFIEQDINSDVESKLKLKDITAYNKKWTYTQLIEDWKKAKQSQEAYDKLSNDYNTLLGSQEQLGKDLQTAIDLANTNEEALKTVKTELDTLKLNTITIAKYNTDINTLKQSINKKVTEAKENAIKNLSNTALLKELLNRLKGK